MLELDIQRYLYKPEYSAEKLRLMEEELNVYQWKQKWSLCALQQSFGPNMDRGVLETNFRMVKRRF